MKKAASLAIAVLQAILLAACQSENPYEESSSSTSPPSQSQDSESSKPVTESSDISESTCAKIPMTACFTLAPLPPRPALRPSVVCCRG